MVGEHNVCRPCFILLVAPVSALSSCFALAVRSCHFVWIRVFEADPSPAPLSSACIVQAMQFCFFAGTLATIKVSHFRFFSSLFSESWRFSTSNDRNKMQVTYSAFSRRNYFVYLGHGSWPYAISFRKNVLGGNMEFLTRATTEVHHCTTFLLRLRCSHLNFGA